MLVSFDTNTLIWGIRGVATEGQEGNIPIAKVLIDSLEAEQATIQLAIAAPVLAEYVGGFPEPRQQQEFAALSHRFVICPFDSKAAYIASQILAKRELVSQVRADGATRRIAHADLKIVAACAAFGVHTLFSNDGGVLKLGAGRLRVRTITQPLFDPPPVSPEPPKSQERLLRFLDLDATAE
jgi:hypothetical protein